MGKKSQSTSTVYGNTTVSNPYAVSKSDNNGSKTNFQEGTALDSIYKFVNNNMNNLLDEYLNPNLNSKTNQAKIKSFSNSLQNESYKNMENGIINPLSRRNMIRSSQATDMYKNLSNSNNNALSSFLDNLLVESQNNTAKVMETLLSQYLSGYNVLSDMQNKSFKSSEGNATKTTTNKPSTLENVSSVMKMLQSSPNSLSGLAKFM